GGLLRTREARVRRMWPPTRRASGGSRRSAFHRDGSSRIACRAPWEESPALLPGGGVRSLARRLSRTGTASAVMSSARGVWGGNNSLSAHERFVGGDGPGRGATNEMDDRRGGGRAAADS